MHTIAAVSWNLLIDVLKYYKNIKFQDQERDMSDEFDYDAARKFIKLKSKEKKQKSLDLYEKAAKEAEEIITLIKENFPVNEYISGDLFCFRNGLMKILI